MQFNEYIGIPFINGGNTRKGCDCWRLIVMIYREKLGIDLPDFSEIYIDGSLTSLKRVTWHIIEARKTWEKVDKPAPFDLILLRTGNMVYHCGLVIGRRTMLHIMENINSAVEEFTSLQWKHRIEGFYRYAR
jgi:cell wall-associated NlpC family hydrolase